MISASERWISSTVLVKRLLSDHCRLQQSPGDLHDEAGPNPRTGLGKVTKNRLFSSAKSICLAKRNLPAPCNTLSYTCINTIVMTPNTGTAPSPTAACAAHPRAASHLIAAEERDQEAADPSPPPAPRYPPHSPPRFTARAEHSRRTIHTLHVFAWDSVLSAVSRHRFDVHPTAHGFVQMLLPRLLAQGPGTCRETTHGAENILLEALHFVLHLCFR